MTSDPRSRQQLLLGAALLAVALVSVVGWRTLAKTPLVLAAAPATADLAPLTAFLVRPTDSVALASQLDSVFVRRDPFGVASTVIASVGEETTRAPKSSDSELVVNAVLITNSHKAAVINDAIVNLGDTVTGGGRLTAVESDRVVVTDGRGVRRTFSVKEGNP